MRSKTVTTVEEYIDEFPPEVKLRLKAMRKAVIQAAPQAIENISYGMPAYKLNGKPLVYFAGYDHHIGFYATPTGHQAFAKELAKYKQGKGSVQFPHSEPLPLKLIERMVKVRTKKPRKEKEER